MSTVYLSHRAIEPLKSYLRRAGHEVVEVSDDPRFGPGVESHADLRYCKLGVRGPVLERETPPFSPDYPDNAAMCALVLDRFLIHRLDITDAHVLQYCRTRGFREIHIRQGYARCACVAVDGRSVITSDPGLFRALSRIPELDVLRVREGFVALPGYPTGFLGGASGRVGDEIVINGDLSRHPDFEIMREFIRAHGLALRHFPGEALVDIGSIIENGG